MKEFSVNNSSHFFINIWFSIFSESTFRSWWRIDEVDQRHQLSESSSIPLNGSGTIMLGQSKYLKILDDF